MKYVWGVLVAMGAAILALFRVNSSLRSKAKLKEVQAADKELESKQKDVKIEKGKLQKELASFTKEVKNSELSDSEIEDFWKDRNSKK
jgi:septal ring factor EnvC (AmiA/AmiB activator)